MKPNLDPQPSSPLTVLPLPPGARVDEVGGGMQPWWFNGQWLAVSAFHVARSVEDLSRWYRQVLGGHWVQREVPGGLVLGRAEGAEAWTIQLHHEPAGAGVLNTRGLLAVQRRADPSGGGGPLPGVPRGAQVLSHLRTREGTRTAEHLVWRHPQAAVATAQWLQSHLARRGYVLERQSPSGAVRTLWFGGAGREATAIVAQAAAGDSTVVLQTVEPTEAP